MLSIATACGFASLTKSVAALPINLGAAAGGGDMVCCCSGRTFSFRSKMRSASSRNGFLEVGLGGAPLGSGDTLRLRNGLLDARFTVNPFCASKVDQSQQTFDTIPSSHQAGADGSRQPPGTPKRACLDCGVAIFGSARLNIRITYRRRLFGRKTCCL